jgi:hypothetical protein
MVSQTNQVKSAGSEESPLQAVASTTGSFAEDVITLAELQARLLQLDGADWARERLRPVIFAFIGAGIGLGLVPIALLTLAAILNQFANFTYAQSLGIALVVGAAISAAMMLAAYSALQKAASPFSRTRGEWDANLRWLRNMIRRQGRRW